MTSPLNSYSTGTVAVAADGTTVTGTSTIWSSAGNVKPGDLFQSGHYVVPITDVTDDTHLVITPWPGSTLSGASYTIWKVSQQRIVGETYARDVDKMVGAMDTSGFFVFVNVNQTVPDPSLGDDGQYAFQPTTGKTWVKSAGVWSYLGIYKAFQLKGAWSGATAYTVGDVVSLSGSSYACVLDHTNHAPPNVTYWQLLASVGSTGATGAAPLAPISPWATATAYVVGPPASFVSQSGSAYECLAPHTSGTFATDLAAGKWGLVAAKGMDGTGTGDLQAANHLTDVTVTAAGAGAVARTAAGKLKDIISVMDFGAVGDGSTDDLTAISRAIDTALAADATLYFPAKTFLISAQIVKTSAHRLRMIGEGPASTALYWPNAAGGLDFTYSTEALPPIFDGLSFQTGVAGGGTALKITAPVIASVTHVGAEVSNCNFEPSNDSSFYWGTGLHFLNCWYPTVDRCRLKGKNESVLPFSMTNGILADATQVCRVSRSVAFHMKNAFLTTGGHGEGIEISGCEFVGVQYGIVHQLGSPTSGTSIHDTHINAYTRCIQLQNIWQMSVHDCLLFKTNLSSDNWQGIELLACNYCDIHDNNLSAPGVTSGDENGITLVNSVDNQIHDNNFNNWFNGQGIIVATGSGLNAIYNNKKALSAAQPANVVLFSGSLLTNVCWNNYPLVTAPFAANDATPSVGNPTSERFVTANSSATAITNFDDGYEGQKLLININDVSTSFVHDISKIILKGNANVTTGTGAGSYIGFLREATRWVEISRGF
ncbi:glycosyl hydrolase family 28-related protein [Bradyrhizobium barranii]|uniref:carbohydrate-binding protein n=1 Tax=Bradyrhizobium barranii TaxID=2992140 RepID=UPI0024AF2C78|nr:carbohydrate-binding protein [Bradyrhizobium barranii]WFT91415.1 glycosyl hydrolase family 28-related protein [Bradyrhizobium barranii]